MAPTLQLTIITSCSAERLARIGAGLLAQMEREPERAPRLVVASLEGEAFSLGRHQRLASAIDVAKAGSPRVLRRNSGGRTLHLSGGTVGLLLAVPEMGSLLAGPISPDKVVNRYVRGLLAGLTRAGAPGGAHYFGRDFISAQSKQIATIGQDNRTRAALFEAFIAVDQPLPLPRELNNYPPHGDPRAAGPEPTSLAALTGKAIPREALLEAIAQGYASVHGCELVRADDSDLPELPLMPAATEDETGWNDSGVADIPIGFAEALVRTSGDHLVGARLRGDFLAPAFVMDQLERSLAGAELNFSELGHRVDAAFHQPGAFSLGLRELRVLAEAMLAAAGRL